VQSDTPPKLASCPALEQDARARTSRRVADFALLLIVLAFASLWMARER
jgi:hypothetical protein